MALPYELPHYLACVLRASRVVALNGSDGFRRSGMKTPLLSGIAIIAVLLEPLVRGKVQGGCQRDLPAARFALQAHL